ncbi:MAG: NAD(P)H-quinone oxidoreductase [Acidobacteriaceae bacterium]
MAAMMRQIGMESPGGPEVMQVVEGARPEAGAGEVLIRVRAAGVNRADLLQRAGKYPPPADASPVLGLEVAGEITALGEGVTAWKVGDAVCSLTHGGGYAEFVVVPAGHCLPVPKGFSMVEAAALPEAAMTVWSNVFEAARLAEGESLLVHGGASGVGSCAVQYGVALGHRVFATAGSDAKCEAVRKLGAEALNYRAEDFVTVVWESTGGHGVDVILDMVGGDYLARDLHALAMDGRVSVIATQGGRRAEFDVALMMRKRAVITGSMLRPRTVAEKAAIVAALREKIWPLYESGRIKPLLHGVYALENAAEAHRELESGGHIGKLVLTVA